MDDLNKVVLILNFLFLIALFVFVIFAKSYFPKYLENKAKNLATKEDMGEITSIVESIKQSKAIELELLAQQHRFEIMRLEQVNDLRMAALDKRLEVYQDAYELVYGMLEAVGHRAEEIKILQKAGEFWKTKSLYMSEEVRAKIDKAMLATNMYESTRDPSSPVSLADLRKQISDTLRSIEAAVNLPSFVNAAEVEAENSLRHKNS